MNSEVKSVPAHEQQLDIPALGRTLNHYFIDYSGCLREVLETTFMAAIAITVGLLVGPLQKHIDCH